MQHARRKSQQGHCTLQQQQQHNTTGSGYQSKLQHQLPHTAQLPALEHSSISGGAQQALTVGLRVRSTGGWPLRTAPPASGSPCWRCIDVQSHEARTQSVEGLEEALAEFLQAANHTLSNPASEDREQHSDILNTYSNTQCYTEHHTNLVTTWYTAATYRGKGQPSNYLVHSSN